MYFIHALCVPVCVCFCLCVFFFACTEKEYTWVHHQYAFFLTLMFTVFFYLFIFSHLWLDSGMLLETGSAHVRSLLTSHHSLKQAVAKAKTVYIRHLQLNHGQSPPGEDCHSESPCGEDCHHESPGGEDCHHPSPSNFHQQSLSCDKGIR
jgi:hypothetical protein